MPRELTSTPRFDTSLLTGMDEPVRRYFTHAIGEGTPLGGRVRLRMEGRIKVGRWLPFEAEQDIDGRSFTWRARAGWGRFRPLEVIDRYSQGEGEMRGRLFGRLPLFHAADPDTTRSAAGRTALESVAFAPTATLLSQSGVRWRAEGEDRIAAQFYLAPEEPEVHARIDEHGGLRQLSALRWGNVGRKPFGYIPCGAEIQGETRFGELTLPSALTVGWWFDTPRYAPFFVARIVSARVV